LAEDRGCSFKLDISGCDEDRLSEYRLNRLNIIEDLASEQEVASLKNKHAKSPKKLIHRMIRNLMIKKVRHFRDVNWFTFDEMLFRTNLPLYIAGGFQSYKYFDKHRNILVKELVPKNDLAGKNEEFAAHISSCNSVSLHVRRGDYVFDEKTHRKHGVLPLDYYKRAVDIIKRKIEDPVFFVFSDDKEWVKENLKFNCQTVFVDHNGAESGHEDMRLMSLCKSNITANSSFSWWGAYLNSNPEKNVIAPEKWLADKKVNLDDLIPKNWLVI
jgi:hypothetical protein